MKREINEYMSFLGRQFKETYEGTKHFVNILVDEYKTGKKKEPLVSEEYINRIDEDWIKEHYTEEEIAEFKNKMKNLSVRLNLVEYVRYKNFKDAHLERCKNSENGPVHVQVSLMVSETGIGTAFTAICENCGESVNITDYTCW